MAYLTLFCRKFPKNSRKKSQRSGRGVKLVVLQASLTLNYQLNNILLQGTVSASIKKKISFIALLPAIKLDD